MGCKGKSKVRQKQGEPLKKKLQTTAARTQFMNKEKRVTRNEEFTRIIQKKKSLKSTSFIVYYQPKKENLPRIGISVGKKLGNAVVRNRIKRQMRAMIDEVFDFQEGCDYIIIARPSFLKRSYQEAKDELAYIRKKQRAQRGENDERFTEKKV